MAEMERPGFQQAFDTHKAYLSNFSFADNDYRFLALMGNSGVMAVLPVELMSKSVFRAPVLTWTLGNHGKYGVFLDLLCPTIDALTVFMPLVCQYLARQPEGAHWLVIDKVLEGSVLWHCLSSSNLIYYCLDPCGMSDVLRCDRSFAVRLACNSTSHNRSLNKARRRSHKLGTLVYQTIESQNELLGALIPS